MIEKYILHLIVGSLGIAGGWYLKRAKLWLKNFIQNRMEKNENKSIEDHLDESEKIIVHHKVGIIFAQTKMRKPNGQELQNMGLNSLYDFMAIVNGEVGLNKDLNATFDPERENYIAELTEQVAALTDQLRYFNGTLPNLKAPGLIDRWKSNIRELKEEIEWDNFIIYEQKSLQVNAYKVAKYLGVEISDLFA